MRTPYLTNLPQNTWDVATFPGKGHFLQSLVSLQGSLRAEKQPQCSPSANIPLTPEPPRQEILFSRPGGVCGLPLPPSGSIQACSRAGPGAVLLPGAVSPAGPGSPGQEPGGLLAGQLSHSPTCHLQRALRCCDLLSPTILGKLCKPQLSKGEITGPPKHSAAGYRPKSSVWLIPQLIYLPRQGAAVCAILLLLRPLPAQLVSLPSLQELPLEVTERSRKMKLALLHARQKG